MAYTATIVKNIVAGSDRGVIYNVTADAASGAVATTLGFIDGYSFGPISMSTSSPKVRVNTTVASAAANGSIFISSAANGDNFFLILWGRS